jgi:hypothetical protein
VFTINKTLYDAAVGANNIYNLHDYINIPTTAESILGFGDEYFFYGNLITKTLTTKYRTKFNITIPPTRFNSTTNPTWTNSGQNVHVSEIGVYDNNNNLVVVGKTNLPIEKAPNSTLILEMAFDL